MRSRPFSLHARARAFIPALQGLVLLVRSEHNARVHAAATVAVGVSALLLGCTAGELGLLLLAVAAVWTAEALNSALERLADCVTREPHPEVGAAKDLAAGAVLASSLGAAGVGLLVLGPRLLGWLGFG